MATKPLSGPQWSAVFPIARDAREESSKYTAQCSVPRTTADHSLQQGACAALEIAAKRRGLLGLEEAWARFTERQRALVPAQYLDELRAERGIVPQVTGNKCAFPRSVVYEAVGLVNTASADRTLPVLLAESIKVVESKWLDDFVTH